MTEAELLAALPDMVFRAILLLARIGAVVMLMPGLGEQEVPTNIRLGLGFALVIVLHPVLAPALPAAPDSAGELLRLILVEIIIGIWYGALARLVTLAMSMAGQLFALLIGLSQVLVPDPATGGQNAITGRFFTLISVLLFLTTGLYALPLRALAESYAVMPVGEGFLAGPGAEAMAEAVGKSLIVALQLVAPFFLLSVVLNVAFGLMARIAPQVQIYFLVVPGQLLLGMLLLGLLLPSMLGLYASIARETFLALPGTR
ncbi:MAG: flagellar biosynthetic protein FliR [Roseomonas sp.]